jgi:hypothetical protein
MTSSQALSAFRQHIVSILMNEDFNVEVGEHASSTYKPI